MRMIKTEGINLFCFACGGHGQSYFGLGQQSSGQTQQLPLSHRKGLSSLSHCSIQTTWDKQTQLEVWGGGQRATNVWLLGPSPTHPVDRSAQVTLLQHIQQLQVRVLPTRVQILPDGPTEQEGVLGNYGQPRPAGGATTTQMSYFCRITSK